MREITDRERRWALEQEHRRLTLVAENHWRQYVAARAQADSLEWGLAALEYEAHNGALEAPAVPAEGGEDV